MNLKIKTLPSFDKELKKLSKRYRSIKKDMKQLYHELLENQNAGIKIVDNCYKIRLANSSIPTGRSGGFRVIYYYVDEEKNLYLMAMYSKSELENVSDEKILNILKAYDL